MEMLVIGIDGGTKEIIDGMPMQFTHSLFKEANEKILKEDPLSRGWAEVLTGEHCSENKGFYMSPYTEKGYEFNHGYSKTVMVKESNNQPIWKVVNNKGKKVGILNVPTTGPVDNVNGFMIAGGGGGLSTIGGYPKEMYYPNSSERILHKNNYTFDIRLNWGELNVVDFIKKISAAEVNQRNAFNDLNQENNIDFGFYCIRMITEVQYLCRYEIERCIEGLVKAKSKGENFIPENEVQKALIEYYKTVDENIKSVFTALQPKEFLFVSDHNTSLYEKEMNLDVWLKQNDFLYQANLFERFIHKLKYSEKSRRLLMKLGLKKKRPTRKMITIFKPNKTQAFGTFFDTGNFAGMFINDYQRFGGPVKTQQEINSLILNICEKFNSDSEAIKHQMQAKPYRQKYKDSKFYNLMPDIMIEKPDTIYCSGKNWKFIKANSRLKPFKKDLNDAMYPYTGLKGRQPLFVYSKNLENLIEQDDPNDLRLAYNLINRFFSSNKVDQ